MSVTGDKLYEEVWAEPMAKVAVRYRISANYLPGYVTTSTSPSRIGATGRDQRQARNGVIIGPGNGHLTRAKCSGIGRSVSV